MSNPRNRARQSGQPFRSPDRSVVSVSRRDTRLRYWIVVLLGVWLAVAVQAAPVAPRFDPQPNNAVLGIVADEDSGRVLIGGRFNQFDGEARALVAAVDQAGRLLAEPVPALWPSASSVKAIVAEPDGRLIIGGWFSPHVGGSYVGPTGLARLNPDGSVDGDFHAPMFDGPVNVVLRLPDGRLLVGGSFAHVDGQPHGRIIRLQPEGQIDESFTFSISEPGASVEAMALTHGERVYVGGRFFNDGHLLRLDPEGNVEPDFTPQLDEYVTAIAVSEHDPRPVIGGMFMEVSGQPRRYLARLHEDGSLDEGFNPGDVTGTPMIDRVYALAYDHEQRLLVGGNFDRIGDHFRSHLARLQGEGDMDPDFAPAFNGPVLTFATHSDGSIYVAGPFSEVEGQPRAGLVKLDSAGGVIGEPPGPLFPPRNDSGQTRCSDNNGDTIPCNQPTHPDQDGHGGRDAAAADNVLSKIGGGSGGFDFTKIANNGSDLPEAAALGFGTGDWACTRDNLSGLLWEIKLNAPGFGVNPRHFEWAFHWYNPDPLNDGGEPGFPSEVSLGCGFTIECDTTAFLAYLNSIQLCGRTDWRLPTLAELHNIVNYNSSFHTGGAMDRVYFADGGGYSGYGGGWTSDTAIEPSPHHAWSINFDDGSVMNAPKGGLLPIRAVAGTLHETTSGPDPVCGAIENPQILPSTAGAYTVDGALARDLRNGLVWDRCSLGQTLSNQGDEGLSCVGEAIQMSWDQAQREVKARNAAGYLGHNDWRLPNTKEIFTQLERRCAQPFVDMRVFPVTDVEPHWTSTTNMIEPSLAFSVQYEFGHHLSVPKDQTLGRIRLVRGGDGFDGYRGTPAYEIAGTVSGLIGANLRLRLVGGGGVDEVRIVNENGRFAFVNGLADGSSFTVSLAQAPFPNQVCTIANGQGTITGADVGNVTVACAPPSPPVIAVDDDPLAFSIPENGSTSGSVAITNTGGGFLDWSINTAYSEANPLVIAGGTSCDGGPDLLFNDDGTVELAYGGNAAWEGGVSIVEHFTPSSYPASIRSVCFGLAGTGGVSSLAFRVVILDDNGPSGSPGTELASLPVVATGLPQFPVSTPQWYQVDLGSVYSTIDSGSVYVGLHWQVSNPQVFVLSDETPDRPVGHGGGYYWNRSGSGQWGPIQVGFADYRAMFIRAIQGGPQAPPTGCAAPSSVPWLSVSPANGSTAEGQTSQVAININGSGILPGVYSALLCLESNDSSNGLVEIPVTLTVQESPGALSLEPSLVGFGPVGLGDISDDESVMIQNTGVGPVRTITIAAAVAPFSRSGGDCPSTPFDLLPGEACSAIYRFQPNQLGQASQFLPVGSNVATVQFALTGTGVVGAPADIVVLSGSNQQTTVATAFPQALAVQVRDAFNNPVPGADVRFDAPASGPSAQVPSTVVVTDGNGVASVTAIANAQAGSYQIQARLPDSGEVVSFALTNVAVSADIAVSIWSSRDHVRRGQMLDYLVTVQNVGPDAASGVAVASSLSSLLDVDVAVWACLGMGQSGCTVSGQGDLVDEGLVLASGAAVTYVLSAPVRLDAAEERVVTGLHADFPGDNEPGNDEAVASSQIVLFRDDFEMYGDGTLSLVHEGTWKAPLRSRLEVTGDRKDGIEAVVQGAVGSNEGVRIDRAVSGSIAGWRVLDRDGQDRERGSAWLTTAADASVDVVLDEFDGESSDACNGDDCARLSVFSTDGRTVWLPVNAGPHRIRTASAESAHGDDSLE